MLLGIRPCAECGKKLQLKITRDLNRKKFCSHSCRQKWRYKNGQFIWLDRMIASAQTLEANAKKAHHGKDHPNWIEDRSKVKFRPRYELNIWRKMVFDRDNYTCQHCGVRGGSLQADHIKPYALYPELRWELNNGRTLCVDCHKKTDTYGYKTSEELKRRRAA